jgi:hypothetical protein
VTSCESRVTKAQVLAIVRQHMCIVLLTLAHQSVSLPVILCVQALGDEVRAKLPPLLNETMSMHNRCPGAPTHGPGVHAPCCINKRADELRADELHAKLAVTKAQVLAIVRHSLTNTISLTHVCACAGAG